MKLYYFLFYLVLFIGVISAEENSVINDQSLVKAGKIRAAIEFSTHSAVFFVARAKGWFVEAGLDVDDFRSYATGTTLAATLARGQIDMALICLIPAVVAKANGDVSFKIVSGAHKYGYGMAVNSQQIKNVTDMQKPGLRIACPREGTPTDVLLQRFIRNYELDETKIKANIVRVPPFRIPAMLKSGAVVAGVMSEHWFSEAVKDENFSVLFTAEKLWPGMQGSVLMVTDDLIKNHPQAVQAVVDIIRRAADFIAANPAEAADIISAQLALSKPEEANLKISENTMQFSRSVIQENFARMPCSADISKEDVQAAIDELVLLNYIKPFPVSEIFDDSFLTAISE
jgi:NitT/TauT family transport system substrate-binding protein